MIRQHERDSSVIMECTNCKTNWVVRYPTPKSLESSSKRHFTSCLGAEPRPLPKMPRIYNLPQHASNPWGRS